MNAEMDISKNQWRSTGGMNSEKKSGKFEAFLVRNQPFYNSCHETVGS